MISILILIETMVLYASEQKCLVRFFDIFSPIFFIYFLPMLASTAGLIDPKAPVLGLITTYVLPMALFLLLVTVDMRAIFRLGDKALLMFFIGSLGIMTGAVVAFVLVKGVIGPQFWGGFGALSASWTGGSANMIAVKEALPVPDNVFLPMVIVDTIVPYVWMGLLIAAVRLQPAFDRWNRADRSVLEALHRHSGATAVGISALTPWGIAVVLACAAVAGLVSQWLGAQLPAVKNIIGPAAWTIIAVTSLALLLSFTPARRLETLGANKAGAWLLYFVLTAIGAKAALTDLGASVVLIGAGFIIVAVHLVFLLAGARFLRAPLFLVAASSQACIGGVASAPVVAAVYEPALASVGLLLAILGNIVGTYLGVICAHWCRFFS